MKLFLVLLLVGAACSSPYYSQESFEDFHSGFRHEQESAETSASFESSERALAELNGPINVQANSKESAWERPIPTLQTVGPTTTQKSVELKPLPTEISYFEDEALGTVAPPRLITLTPEDEQKPIDVHTLAPPSEEEQKPIVMYTLAPPPPLQMETLKPIMLQPEIEPELTLQTLSPLKENEETTQPPVELKCLKPGC